MHETLTRRARGWRTLPAVAVAGWVVLELVVRVGGIVVGGTLLVSPLAGDWLALLVGFPMIAALLSRYALRAGQSRADWEYDWSRRTVVVGLVAGLSGIGLAVAGSLVDAALFGSGSTVAAGNAVVGALRATPWAAALLLLGNGVAVPLAEERVWRGVLQTELVDAWGPAAGVLATAVLFSLKHVVVDASLGRLVTIVLLGLLWGGVRHRWGTGASTVAHLVANSLLSALVVATALA